MQLNLTRHVVVPLSPERCLRELQEAVNDKSNPLFWFPLIGRFRFRSNNPKRFRVAPGFWGGGPIMEGFVKTEQDNSCQIYIRLMPPLWFMFVFTLVPLLLVGILQTQHEKVIFMGWLCSWVLIFISYFFCSFRLIKGFDQIFGSLNSKMALTATLSAKLIFRKVAIYLLVAILYIAGLMILGLLMS